MNKQSRFSICLSILSLIVIIACSLCFCSCFQPNEYSRGIDQSNALTIQDMVGTYDHIHPLRTTYCKLENFDICIDITGLGMGTEGPNYYIRNAYQITKDGYYTWGYAKNSPGYIPLYVPNKIDSDTANDVNQIIETYYGPVVLTDNTIQFVNSELEYVFDPSEAIHPAGYLSALQIPLLVESNSLWDLEIMLLLWALPVDEEFGRFKYCEVVYHKRYHDSKWQGRDINISLIKELSNQ